MSEEIHELAVKIHPSGIEETTQGLDDVQEGFQETAEETEKQSALLSDMAKEFQGAGKVVLAGLGTVSAGLLARIPVIGEAMGGLEAVFGSLIRQVDEEFRPVIGDLTTAFFDLADEIDGADGNLEDFIDSAALATFTFLGLTAVVGATAGALFALSAVAGIIGGSLLGLLGTIGLISIVVGAAALAWKRNFLEMRDLTKSFIDNILEGRWKDALGNWLQLQENALNFAIDAFVKFGGEVARVFLHGWNKTLTITEKFLNFLQTGVEATFALLIREAKSWGNRFAGIIESAVNRALSAVPSDVLETAGLPSSVSIGQPFGDVASRGEVIQRVARRGQRRSRGIERRERERSRTIDKRVDQLIAALQNQDVEIPLSIDAKTVAEQTEKWAGNSARNAGANQFVR